MSTEGSPIMGHPVQGSSAVIGPDGRVLTTTTTANEELIIFDLDMEQVVKAKTFADAGGHCNFFPEFGSEPRADSYTDSRPDMLWLGADPSSKKVVRVTMAPTT